MQHIEQEEGCQEEYCCSLCSGMHWRTDQYCDYTGKTLARLRPPAGIVDIVLPAAKEPVNCTLFPLANEGAGSLEIHLETDSRSRTWIDVPALMTLVAGRDYSLSAMIATAQWPLESHRAEALLTITEAEGKPSFSVTIRFHREVPAISSDEIDNIAGAVSRGAKAYYRPDKLGLPRVQSDPNVQNNDRTPPEPLERPWRLPRRKRADQSASGLEIKAGDAPPKAPDHVAKLTEPDSEYQEEREGSVDKMHVDSASAPKFDTKSRSGSKRAGPVPPGPVSARSPDRKSVPTAIGVEADGSEAWSDGSPTTGSEIQPRDAVHLVWLITAVTIFVAAVITIAIVFLTHHR